jgi:hypothetical protein
MFLLLCESKKCDEKGLKLATIQPLEDRGQECTLSEDRLNTDCGVRGPSVEKFCSTVQRTGLEANHSQISNARLRMCVTIPTLCIAWCTRNYFIFS